MKILITTGGSGGHVIPAQVLYQFLKNKTLCHWTVDQRGLKYTQEPVQYCWNSQGSNIFFRIIKIFFYFLKLYGLLENIIPLLVLGLTIPSLFY